MCRSYLPFKPVFSLLVFGLAAAGCSLRAPLPNLDDQQDKLAQVMSSGAYQPARNSAIETSRDIWIHDRSELEVEIMVPAASGTYPVLIYLPSLGENAGAGRLWRETWAKAGYAVFSLQPVAISVALKALESERKYQEPTDPIDDEELAILEERAGEARPDSESSNTWFGGKRRLGPSRTARDSEMRYVGHQYFSAENLRERLGHLAWAYQQLQIRAGSRQPGFTALNFSQTVLAGYDLGAQTVAAALVDSELRGLIKPTAAVILSPSVDLAEGNIRSRFQTLDLPLLAVTGTDDSDPYAVSAAQVRTALWEYAPAGDKYLLLLQGGGHKVLAGNEFGGRFSMLARRRAELGLDDEQLSGERRRARNAGLSPDAVFGRAPKPDPDIGYKHVAAIASVSSAFLDMLVKKDPFARAWLNDQADQWMGRAASLKVR